MPTHRGVFFAEGLEPRLLLAAGVVLVKDIVPGPDPGLALAFTLRKAVSAKGKFFFEAVDADHGSQLWVSDGDATGAGTKPLIPDDVTGSASIDNVTAGDGVVYFTAFGKFGTQIFQTGGSKDTTEGVTQLTQGTIPTELGFANGKLFFNTQATSSPNLWRFAPAPNAAPEVVAPNVLIHSLGTFNNKLLYETDKDFPGGAGQGTYLTDGKTVTFLHASTPYLMNEQPAVTMNGEAYFSSYSDAEGYEIWKTNGTAGGTKRISNVFNGQNNIFQQVDLNVVGSKVYFGWSGMLYVTDGKTTTRVTSFTDIGDLAAFDGTIFFTHDHNLYKLVNNDQPVRVGSTSGGVQGGTSPAFLTPIKDKLYFSALDLKGKARLFESDGGAIFLVAGETITDPVALTNVQGALYFQGSDAAHGSELFMVPAEAEPPPPPPFSLSLRVESLRPKELNKVRHTINEGEELRFELHVEGDTLTKVDWDWKDGTFTKGGDTRDHIFENNLKNDATRFVTAKVTTAKHGIKTLTTEVTVQNTAPEFSVFQPLEWVTYYPYRAEVNLYDRGVKDKVIINVSWGDGKTETKKVVGSPAGTIETLTHQYQTTSSRGRTVRFEVDDQEGGVTVVKRTVRFLPFARVLSEGTPSVVVGGTNGGDKIQFVRDGVDPDGKVRITVFVNGDQRTLTVDPKEVFQFSGGPGNDSFDVDPKLTNPFVLFTDGDDIVNYSEGSVQPAEGVALFGTPLGELLEVKAAPKQPDDGSENVNLVINEIKVAAFQKLISPKKIGIYAGKGADKLVSTLTKVGVDFFAGPGNDFLVAGQSITRMLGGPGSDKFKNVDDNDSTKQ